MTTVLPGDIRAITTVVTVTGMFRGTLAGRHYAPPMGDRLCGLIRGPIRFPGAFTSMGRGVVVVEVKRCDDAGDDRGCPFTVRFIVVSRLPLHSGRYPLRSWEK